MIYYQLAGMTQYLKAVNKVMVSRRMPFLSLAIDNDSREVARYLIETGADVNQPDNLQYADSPFFYAI